MSFLIFNNVTNFSENFEENTIFRLTWAKCRLEFYARPFHRWQKFHHYVERDKFIDNYVSNICPRGQRTLVYAGDAEFGSGIKG